MITATDQMILSTLEAVEIACRKAEGSPVPARAIAEALAEHRKLLTRLLADRD